MFWRDGHIMGRFFVGALVFVALLPRARSDGPEALLVIAADQHSAYERTAAVVATVDQLKAEHPGLPLAILLDGDTLEYGNVVARRSQGLVDFAMLSELAKRGPTVVNLGNHETEFYDLVDTVKQIEATGAQVVTNITDRSTGRLAASPFVQLSLGLRKAVVVGVATDDVTTYRDAVRPLLGLTDPIAWARARFPGFLGKAPLKIILSHAGLKADRGMLPIVPDGTLFAGAHDHLRLVQFFGRTAYVHSGAWNTYLTLAWLQHDAAGAPRWDVEQRLISGDRADPKLSALIRETQVRYLTPTDREVVARIPAALAPYAAARLVTSALRSGVRADASFVPNTTFGNGFSSPEVTRAAFDACVRFDGPIFVGTVDGARLRELLKVANQTVDTPFAQRTGEFNMAEAPATIEDAQSYRIVTTDWGAKNSSRYFGASPILWHEQSGSTLKEVVLHAIEELK